LRKKRPVVEWEQKSNFHLCGCRHVDPSIRSTLPEAAGEFSTAIAREYHD
jgi:hypothetical protein